jgi:hypothetical protein
MELIEILIIVGVVWFALRIYQIKRDLDIAIEEERGFPSLKKSLPAEDTDEIETLILKTEVVNGQIYVWNSETNVFLTQGPSVEDVIKFFVKHHRGKRIVFGGDLTK